MFNDDDNTNFRFDFQWQGNELVSEQERAQQRTIQQLQAVAPLRSGDPFQLPLFAKYQYYPLDSAILQHASQWDVENINIPVSSELQGWLSASKVASPTISTIPLRKRLFLGEQTRLETITQQSDLEKNVYEGGFKLWECAIDLTQFLYDHLSYSASISSSGVAGNLLPSQLSFDLPSLSLSPSILARLAESQSCGRVLELGCGHGLAGLFTLFYMKASAVVFQDLNEEVIQQCTQPNVLLNSKIETSSNPAQYVSDLAQKCAFVCGSWSADAFGSYLSSTPLPTSTSSLFPNCTIQTFDLILTSDTIYSLDSLPSLFSLILTTLSPSGICLIAAKRYYFGVGGSVGAFQELVEKEGRLSLRCLRSLEDGRSNIRDILELSWKTNESSMADEENS